MKLIAVQNSIMKAIFSVITASESFIAKLLHEQG